MTQNQTELWAQLREHLHRGGAWWYLWFSDDKSSRWYGVGKSPTLPREKRDVYFGVHPTRIPRGTAKRATIGDVVAINCLFADLDAKPGGKENARAHVEQLQPAPSVIVDSGGGYHAYWLLRDPFIIASDADRERAKRAQAAWVKFVGGDPGAKDLARVLRVPGGVNYKPEYAPNFPTVEIIAADFDRVYALAALECAAHRAEEKQMPKTKTAPAPKKSASAGANRYANAALTGELDKLSRATEGARNTQLNASAFALGQFIGAGALPRDEVETQLANVAQLVGLNERETRATIRSGVESGMREPRAIPRSGNGHEPRCDPNAEAEQAESAPSIAEQAGQYLVRDGRICRRKKTQDGTVLVPLCNFAARITEQVAHDEGADDVRRFLTLEGTHADGGSLPAARIDAGQFAAMRWVTASWGARAIVEAGSASQDHLRAAIQYLSPNIVSRYVFEHTGWREIGDKRVYLSQGGAIGGASVAVELRKEIERYALPTQPQNVIDAMRESLRFLEIAPKRVTVPLWAAMYLAPLAEIIPLRFMLWVYGATGVYKSALTAVALSHYGDFTQDDLLQWSGTANSLEKYPFLLKDAPLVLDDFAPQNDQLSAQKLEQIAARLVRAVGNHGGRSRLNSDLTLRTIYRPRGLVIATGEQLPNGQSLVGRLVTVEVNKGEVNLSRMSEAQDNREVYPDATAAYIFWLGEQWTQLQETLPPQWRELRAKARQEGQHARLPESIASLYVGFDLGLSFAVACGALTESDAKRLRDEGWTALCGVAERQHGLTEEQRPTRRFLTVIAELLAQGKARLQHTDTPESGGDGEMLGWYDADYLYLLPSAAYHCVAKYERDEGRIFGTKQNALRKMLAEEGLAVVSDDTHLAALARIGGKQRRVLKIIKRDAEKIAGGIPLEKVVTVVTDT
ncbi:MAG: DUF927 domain-containing protein [Chloroflexi bacterium]|nr:DUF927 domain-containing protein [Chloroflexota bacterium]